MTESRFGSDAVVGLLDSLGYRYASLNPGASLRVIHDSAVHAGRPKLVLALQEAVAVSLAHGYAKSSGEPMAVFLHDLVGLQNGSLGIFNAWMDQVPMLVIGGSGPTDSAHRRPWIDWIHTTRNQGLLVRDYVKWDDQPASVDAMAATLVRADRLTRMSPSGPVYVAIDALLQEAPLAADWKAPTGALVANALTAPSADLERLADAIVRAERPVILVDAVGRSRAGYEAVAALADAVAAPVVDFGSRHNLDSDHWADGTAHRVALLADADLVIALDMRDLRWGISEIDLEHHTAVDLVPPGTPIIAMSLTDLTHRGFNDREEVIDADVVVADTAVALPELVSIIHRRGVDRRARREAVSTRLTTLGQAAAPSLEGSLTTANLVACLGEAIAGEPWVLAHGAHGVTGQWARRLWGYRGFNAHLGHTGGGGLGYGIGATLGAALHHRNDDTLIVDLQPDGDMMYTAGGLWTAAHHRIPALFVVVNNRTYGKDRLHQQTVAHIRGRPAPEPSKGIDLDDPPIDFATLATATGVEGIGPIKSVAELRPALERAVRIVREERRAVLVDAIVRR
jgi:thiamine pyrophosphate-dependent acetolactate synthase large subunit-like protein